MEAPPIDAPAAEWLVYGDSLQTKGDPRGALISISHAIAEGKADESVRDAYLKEHAAALLEDAAGFLDSYRFDWQFLLPLAVRVRLGARDGDHQLALLGTPLGRELRELALVGHTDQRESVDLSRAMHAALERRPAHLTRFAFIDERAAQAHMLISRDYAPSQNLVLFGSVVPFFAVAAEIRIAVADAQQLELAPIVGPHLETFTLDCLRFSDYSDSAPMLRQFESAELPELARLRLRLTETWVANIPLEETPYLPVYSQRYEDEVDEDDEPVVNRYEEEADGGDHVGPNWDALGELLAKLATAPLKELALTGFETARPIIEAMDRVGFAPSLEVLDLSDSSLDDEDCAWIAAHPATFGKVRKLVVERTRVTEVGAATLRKLRVEVVHGGAHVAYRYVVGSE
jgi:hypothetical protein